MRYVIVLVLLTLSGFASASTKAETVAVYNTLLLANGMYFYPKLKFSNSKEVNAYQSGNTIVVYQGILNITNRDEIALVLGHELAHYKLHHRQSNWPNEYAADRLGWKYASKAGYNMCRGKNLFKKFRKGASSDHPDPIDRYNRLPRCQNLYTAF